MDGCFVHRTHSLLFAVNLKEVHVSRKLETVMLPKMHKFCFTALQMKMLKHKHSTKTIQTAQPCLAEFSFGINVDGTFDSSKNLSFDVGFYFHANTWQVLISCLFIRHIRNYNYRLTRRH